MRGSCCRTPVSDPDVDLRVKGKLDLADVRRTVKLEGIDQLTGTVAADAAVRTRMSYVDKKQYDKVAASGSVDVGDLTVKGEDAAASACDPAGVAPAGAAARPAQVVRRHDRQQRPPGRPATSTTCSPIAFRDDTLRGSATVRSNRFNLDEWRSGESDLQIIPVPPKIDFGLDATVDELTYGKLTMTNARGRLRVKDQRVTLEDFQMNTLGGQIGVDRLLRDDQPGQADVRRRPQDDQGGHPVRVQGLTTVQMLAPVAKYATGT